MDVLAQQDAILQAAAEALVSKASPRHGLRWREMTGRTGDDNGFQNQG